MNPQSLLYLGFYFGQRDMLLHLPGAAHLTPGMARIQSTLDAAPVEATWAFAALRGLAETIEAFAKGVTKPVSLLESTKGVPHV